MHFTSICVCASVRKVFPKYINDFFRILWHRECRSRSASQPAQPHTIVIPSTFDVEFFFIFRYLCLARRTTELKKCDSKYVRWRCLSDLCRRPAYPVTICAIVSTENVCFVVFSFLKKKLKPMNRHENG